ncbi:MAG: formylmethanofuran dehydrogenase subunit C [Planctomycetales bacterium]|nr:formylmethanofuran dehydrogenase subunit C [Planctomycetales bacterium]
MSLTIRFTADTHVPVEVEGIVPDVVRDMSIDDIRSIQAFHGNEKIKFGDFFDVDGDPTDGVMDWHGDLKGVHWIGAKMKTGRIHVHGCCGRHLGSEMSGGEIHVDGDAGDWVGAELHGGLIHVKGNAGHLVGAAYRGSARGMTSGTILVGGNVGNELGHTMRRGLIAVAGNAGDLVGFNMLAGTILVFGDSGIRHGAGMRRGTIGLFGACDRDPLPSFSPGCDFKPPALNLIFRHLDELGFQTDPVFRSCSYRIFHGDLIEGGRGEIFIPKIAG